MQSEKKIRVLETIRQGKIGGGESHVLDLVSTMDSNQFEPVVLSFTDGPMVTALKQMGIPVQVIYSEKPFDLRVWKKVKKFLKDQQINIVHVHGTRANTNILWAARSLKLPVIYTIHGWSFHDGLHPVARRMRIAAEKFITRRTNVNICVSESNQRSGQSAFGKFDSIVIHNGVNLRKFNAEGTYADIRHQYGFSKNDIVVGYVVRMTYQKDPLGMIKAFAKAHERTQNLKLLMIGEGELKQAAFDLVKEMGIGQSVVFDGFRQDIPAVLKGIDIYCLPSLWEGFPIGVLEAMAMGKVVIASDVDGTREAVQHKENGWLVPAKDTGALASAIERLAKEVSLRTRLQEQARSTIIARYNIESMTDKIEDVYRRLCIS